MTRAQQVSSRSSNPISLSHPLPSDSSQTPRRDTVNSSDSVSSFEEESPHWLYILYKGCCCVWQTIQCMGKSLWFATKCFAKMLRCFCSCIYSLLAYCFCKEEVIEGEQKEEQSPEPIIEPLSESPPNSPRTTLLPIPAPQAITEPSSVKEPEQLVKASALSSKEAIMGNAYSCLQKYLDSETGWEDFVLAIPKYAILREHYEKDVPSLEELKILKKHLDVYLTYIDIDQAINNSRQENNHGLLWFVIDCFKDHEKKFFSYFPKSVDDVNFRKIFNNFGDGLIRERFEDFKNELERKFGFRT